MGQLLQIVHVDIGDGGHIPLGLFLQLGKLGHVGKGDQIVQLAVQIHGIGAGDITSAVLQGNGRSVLQVGQHRLGGEVGGVIRLGVVDGLGGQLADGAFLLLALGRGVQDILQRNAVADIRYRSAEEGVFGAEQRLQRRIGGADAPLLVGDGVGEIHAVFEHIVHLGV